MPAATNTLMIEGSIDELTEELANFIDSQQKSEPIQPEVSRLMKDGKIEDALKVLIPRADALNSAPEKSVIPAYNLLLHIAKQAPNPDMFYARICKHLTKPITSSPQHSQGIALSVLSTMFNIMSPTSESRYHVFMAILAVIKSSGGSFEAIEPQLGNLDQWLEEWKVDDDEQRQLFMEIAQAARAAGEDDEVYRYQIKTLQTFTGESASAPAARKLALDTLKMSLVHPSHFDFQDITALDAIQALQKTDPECFELLELFTSDTLDEFNDFKDEHEGWIEQQEGLDKKALDRKMRLLTLASLAASAGQARRELSYDSIAKALQIPEDEVEMWIIDVIRAGLVEGKLSQLSKTFLIHRSTYRVFGDNQWREIAARLDMWKTSLTGVLQMVRREKENAKTAREQENKEGGEGGKPGQQGQGGYRGRGQRQQNQQQQPQQKDQQPQQQPQQQAVEAEAE